jgi:TonB family protein
MGNSVLTPDQESAKPQTNPAQNSQSPQDTATVLLENDRSIWSSLISNLRDAFSSQKLPPLELTSQPVAVQDAVPQEPLWKDLWQNLQDTFFPKKLPPLELTSQPVAVQDPLAVQRDTKSSILSFLAHAAVLGLILLFALEARHEVKVKPLTAEATNIKPYIPITAPMPKLMGGGGGGGSHDVVEASKGHLPQIAKLQITPPTVIKVNHPKIPAPPTVIMQPMKIPDTNLPNLGVPQSPQVKLASNGTGGGAGIGSGKATGVGSGNGAGVGPGSGANHGGGVYSVGNGVSAPVPIYEVDPEFSDEARRAKYQGVVALQIVVDTKGLPENIQVVRHLGMGLDQKAIEAVKQYRFKPAMYHGHPVPVSIIVEVDFHLY